MKSPSTLIAKHQRQICTLELLQKAEERVNLYKGHLKLWRDKNRMQWVYTVYRREQEIIDNVITANRVYCRIKQHYLKSI